MFPLFSNPRDISVNRFDSFLKGGMYFHPLYLNFYADQPITLMEFYKISEFWTCFDFLNIF